MSSSQSSELLRHLSHAADALARGDTDAGDAAMAAAAELCRQMQDGGLRPQAIELPPLQDLAEQCGASLQKIANALNAESLRDDNHRRAFETYHASLSRP